MSLYQAANGILETHVTWEDVEADLQEKLCTKATFGDNKKAVNISEMKGFMSKIALIEPDWQGVEKGRDLPPKFALKIPSQLAMIELTKMMHFGDGNGYEEEKLKNFSVSTRQCHNTEIDVYNILIKLNHPDIPFTKVYSMKSFDDKNQLKGYLVTEFVSNIHSVQMCDSIPADDLIPVIRGVATFSALCESLPAEETKFAMREECFELLFREFFDENVLAKKYANIQTIFSENHKETAEKVVNVFQLYEGLLPKYTRISEILDLKMVLNHGDLWQSNMIFSKTENGKLKLEALIDWQTVSRLSPGMDLSMLLLVCLSEKDRREREQELLKYYYNTFTNVYGTELFSFNELLNTYYLYSPVMALMFVPDIFTFIDNAKISEEEKVEARKKGMTKIIAIMEDILDIHEYNLKYFPDFFNA
ncbi:hypothetical protein GCK72_020121 [Caenorhabditis remanei]|uniref:CHK kinase-like domain-containing protein n=1 Tax=Caenorhabditis remanei TaxID=31234 RepID=A0A6A5GFN2_CAERE|nr:hypothetical protein GCK72_020121 [Caenorhabditis remanei]KAF1753564.1 hypothetical protein GCK72_020121 [Caenorhabditis remanei]